MTGMPATTCSSASSCRVFPKRETERTNSSCSTSPSTASPASTSAIRSGGRRGDQEPRLSARPHPPSRGSRLQAERARSTSSV
ncbi:MAG: hypothetical protein MZW92_02510 [Comamonadaceae bacterium]|nr:hypothetical protein [Comamonadaceae bacterium]